MPKTLTVTAEYPYQAYATAHRVLRSNVRTISAVNTAQGTVTMTFETASEPRWPVAMRHYSAQARAYANGAVSLMLQGKLAEAREFAAISAQLRTRAADAQTGHVSNPRTLCRKGL